MTAKQAADFLRGYRTPVKIMEVCGTHTSAIVKNGIRDMLSPAIRLVSGPGCPVCVTPAGYVDTLIKYATLPNTCVLSFGDLFRVPGSRASFLDAKAGGSSFRVIYSPLEAAALAMENPHTDYAVAAVGFETTAPVYAVLLEELERRRISNVRLLTALKTMPAALGYLCENQAADGFLCPGHVSSIIGSEAYEPICRKYRKPFVIAGFEPERIVSALCHILFQLDRGERRVQNLYKSAVAPKGNLVAREIIGKYFASSNAVWRGIGNIADSALALRPEYAAYGLEPTEPISDETQTGCRCGDVMLGRIRPDECGLFGAGCAPDHPIGACMVSGEGACGIWHGMRSDWHEN